MITTTILPPPIQQHFNRYLLLSWPDQLKHKIKDEIFPLYNKKVRPQDTGKIRDYAILMKMFEEIYERKKIEEEEYKTKIKNAPKRPSIPTTGGTCRFRKVVTEEQNV